MQTAGRSRRVQPLMALLVSFCCASSVLAAAGSDADPAAPVARDEQLTAIAREVIAEGSYQSELPEIVDQNSGTLVIPWSFGSIPKLVAITLLVALVITGLTWSWSRFYRGEAGSRAGPQSPLAPSAGAGADTDAETLRRHVEQGEFDQAVHLLLLMAISLITRRFGVTTTSGLTSRELLRTFPLEKPASEAFSTLVATVEVTRFGGIRAGEADYRRCLDCYRTAAGSDV